MSPAETAVGAREVGGDPHHASNDGFVVAQRDLELRGPGELLGTRQTGLPDYRIANLVRDAELMPRVQIVAERILRETSDTGAAIMRRWLGDASRYGKV